MQDSLDDYVVGAIGLGVVVGLTSGAMAYIRNAPPLSQNEKCAMIGLVSISVGTIWVCKLEDIMVASEKQSPLVFANKSSVSSILKYGKLLLLGGQFVKAAGLGAIAGTTACNVIDLFTNNVKMPIGETGVDLVGGSSYIGLQWQDGDSAVQIVQDAQEEN